MLKNINSAISTLNMLHLTPLNGVPDLMNNYNNLHQFIIDWSNKQSQLIIDTTSDFQKVIHTWQAINEPKINSLSTLTPIDKSALLNEFGQFTSSLTTANSNFNGLIPDLKNENVKLTQLINLFKNDVTEITNDESRDKNEINRLKLEIINIPYQGIKAIANLFGGHSIAATMNNDKMKINQLQMELNETPNDINTLNQILNLLNVIIPNINNITQIIENTSHMLSSILPNLEHIKNVIPTLNDNQVEVFAKTEVTQVNNVFGSITPTLNVILQ